MANYDYFCEANGKTVEVSHPVDVRLRIWGEVCYVAQCSLGDTDPLAPVRRVFTRAPATVVKIGNAELRNQGFTKLVRRERGVYENVTPIRGEKRYMRDDDPDSVPHIHEKIRD